MPELKLAKLPDRTPSKITITVSSDLSAALRHYANMYRAAYGEDEPVSELIPFMLEAFLESDREFAKARKTIGTSVSPTPSARASGPAAIATGVSKEA